MGMSLQQIEEEEGATKQEQKLANESEQDRQAWWSFEQIFESLEEKEPPSAPDDSKTSGTESFVTCAEQQGSSVSLSIPSTQYAKIRSSTCCRAKKAQ